MALSDLFNLTQFGEPARMDALWAEHERLKRFVDALTQALIEKGHLSREEVDELVNKVRAGDSGAV